MINIGEILHMDMLGITDQVREFEEQIDKNYGKDDSANGKVKKKIEKLIINNDWLIKSVRGVSWIWLKYIFIRFGETRHYEKIWL